MDFDAIDDFVHKIIGIIGSDKRNLPCAVAFAIERAKEISFPSELLFEISNACKKQKMFMEEYVFAKACFSKACGRIREEACVAMSTAAHVMGFSLETEASYLEILKETPDNADVRCVYADLLFELKKIQEAEKEYKMILKTFPTHLKANTGYAYLLAEYGYTREAEEYYSRALNVDPNYVLARGGYANLLFKIGRVRDAEKEYKLAIELNTEDPSLHHNCGA